MQTTDPNLLVNAYNFLTSSSDTDTFKPIMRNDSARSEEPSAQSAFSSRSMRMRSLRQSVLLVVPLLTLSMWNPTRADQTGFEVVPAIQQSIHAETIPPHAGADGSSGACPPANESAGTSSLDQPSEASLPITADDSPVGQPITDPAPTNTNLPQATASPNSEPQSLQSATATPPADYRKVDNYNVPIVLDSEVESHIRYFNTAIRDRFEKWLLRLSHYRPLVERIFSEFELPTDLVYLSLVESGFNPYAYSRARATGPWQFMKGTAKVYGLRVDSYVDERRDPIKSTVAAARYLRDLYDLFGTWPLAMAAYNAGEGKVLRALQKSQSESFVEISQTRFIRRETKEYVPRFMAATIIAKDPERFGFRLADVAPHDFDEVIVHRPIHLQSLAAVSNVPFEVLKNLNPELRRYATPPGEASYHLKVPLGAKSKIESILDRVPTWKAAIEPRSFRSIKTKPPSHTSHKWYRVRGGDTLILIAKRFGLSVEALKHRNRISTRPLRAGELLAIR